jgi:hypothetical protein
MRRKARIGGLKKQVMMLKLRYDLNNSFTQLAQARVRLEQLGYYSNNLGITQTLNSFTQHAQTRVLLEQLGYYSNNSGITQTLNSITQLAQAQVRLEQLGYYSNTPLIYTACSNFSTTHTTHLYAACRFYNWTVHQGMKLVAR